MWYKDGKTYRTIKAIRYELKDISLPTVVSDEVLAEYDFLKVVYATPPETTEGQTLQEGEIEMIEGVPTIGWVIQDVRVSTPQSITPRQARLILLQYGLLDDIEAMVATDKAMEIWWEYSLEILRDNEHIKTAAIALNITDEQLDQMFIDGSKL